MNFYHRIVSTAQAAWSRVMLACNGTLKQQRQAQGCVCTGGRGFSKPPTPFFIRLPANLQFHGRKGFTLIEVMMVIAIIGTLAAIAIPNFISYRERARYTTTIELIKSIEKEITMFNIEEGRYPDDLAEAGLDHLRDPWGNPFRYLNIQTSTGNGKRRKNRNLVPINQDFDLYSMGPDGKSVSPLTARHSRDDIVRANNGAFLGKASDY